MRTSETEKRALTKPSRRLEAVPAYLFAELERLVAEKRQAGIDVISLGIGDPDRPTYAHVVEAMQEAVADPANHGYPTNRGREEFRQAFSLVPEYLRTPEDSYALSEYGPALGRRFRSLKLWAVLRCFGAEGLRAIQREHIRLAELFAGWVEADPGWELVAPQRFSLVVFRREGSDEENEAILERVNRSGEIFLSHTKLNGRYVLRLAIGNACTTEADVRRAWEVLNT